MLINGLRFTVLDSLFLSLSAYIIYEVDLAKRPFGFRSRTCC